MSYGKMRFLFMFLMLVFSVQSSYARWMNKSDASFDVSNYVHDITVNADGTSKEIITIRGKILTESEISNWTNSVLTYDSHSNKINILSAKTMVNGQEFNVDMKSIEDKPLASSKEGFESYNQVLLSFPKLEIGAEVLLQYENINNIPNIESHFTKFIRYNYGEYLRQSIVRIRSEIPLLIESNDPNKRLKIKKNTNGTDIEIIQNFPFIEGVIGEYDNVNGRKLTWVKVSSIKNWQDYANKFKEKYNNIINEKLPLEFVRISNKASKASTDIDLINVVTSELSKKIQYMGDWSNVNGRFFPHHLQHIANKALGDCKDYSVSTAAILRSLGFKVSAVFVMRGAGSLAVPYDLPSLSHFNHVIVKAEKNNKEFWIDPTNFVSMANGIFPDIAGHQALVINDSNPYQKIPNISYDHNESLTKQNYYFTKKGEIIKSGSYELKGESAIGFTALDLELSEQQIKKAIFNKFGDDSLQYESEIIIPNLSSRIVKDLKFQFKIKQPHIFANSNLGKAIKINIWPFVKRIADTDMNAMSDIYIGPIRKLRNYRVIENFHVKFINHKFDCEIITPWLDLTRKVTKKNSQIIIDDLVIIKKSFITNDEFRSKEFRMFKNKINEMLYNVLFIGDVGN